MINWNDIRVEQEIAQERYQDLIRARQLARLSTTNESKPDRYIQIRDWLGNQVISLGCSLKVHCEAA